MCLVGVVVRRYIDFLILLILYLLFFAAASLLFVHFLKMFLLYVFVIGTCDRVRLTVKVHSASQMKNEVKF